MASIIAGALARFKDDVERFLSISFIAQVALEMGLCWRNTPLAIPNVIALFARQILAGNLSMPELARLAGSSFTPEAYCIARGRVPLELLQTLLQRTCDLGKAALARGVGSLWKGHRLWHMDGSSFSMPDTPELLAHFGQSGQQRKGCGFPVAHILCLFDAATGMIQDCILSPLWTHDMSQAARLHPRLRAGDVLIADRAFESFAHLALLLSMGLHAILPIHQMRSIDFRQRERRSGKNGKLLRQRVRRVGRYDQIVRWFKPASKPRWMTPEQFAQLPESICIREIRREVTLASGLKQQITLVTTLLDENQYTPEELIEALKGRWDVEVNLRHLKTTMKMDVLRSKSVEGIQKELWMFLIVYNLVRLIMLEAAERQGVAVRRISFADALYWVRHGDLRQAMPPLQVTPERPGRREPRVIKRRPKQYPFLTRPREVFRNSLRRRKKGEI
jgi:hypothetical protein